MNHAESLLDQVRRSCARVAGQSTRVRVVRERLPAYLDELPVSPGALPVHDPDRHWLGHDAGTVAFFMTLDSVNFGSGYFPHLRKRPGHSGYFTVAACLTDYFRAHGPLPAEALVRLDAADCGRIFGQDPENRVTAELMGLFATAWNELGRHLLDRYGGRFTTLVEAADGSGERLVRLLAEMPLFRDVGTHGGKPVAFYKRAQLTVADLALAFGGQGWGRFDDLDRLTIFADNLVPHVLRLDGVLQYAPDLAARIDEGSLIETGSPEEVELRACAVAAVEELVALARVAGRATTAMELDYVLWNRGQAPAYKQAKPRHRTRTVYY